MSQICLSVERGQANSGCGTAANQAILSAVVPTIAHCGFAFGSRNGSQAHGPTRVHCAGIRCCLTQCCVCLLILLSAAP
jgi:hypothetical protein